MSTIYFFPSKRVDKYISKKKKSKHINRPRKSTGAPERPECVFRVLLYKKCTQHKYDGFEGATNISVDIHTHVVNRVSPVTTSHRNDGCRPETQQMVRGEDDAHTTGGSPSSSSGLGERVGRVRVPKHCIIHHHSYYNTYIVLVTRQYRGS